MTALQRTPPLEAEPAPAPAPAAATPIGAPPAGGVAPAAAVYALFVLTVVTLFALIDRQILVLLSETIRKQLALSDLQLGLLTGTAVTLFAALAAYPLGWLADRFDRRWVLAGCIVVWSLACAGCGLAQSYPQLLAASAVVGAAEAGLVPITYAMIPNLFRPQRLQLANSTFAMATGVGGGAAIALCGMLIGWVELGRMHLPAALQALDGWRLAFFAAALPAPLMVALMLSLPAGRPLRQGRQPARAQPAPAAQAAGLAPAAPGGMALLLPHLRAHRRTFTCFFGGVGLSFFGFFAVGGWIANLLIRQFAQTPQQVGSGMGTAGVIGLLLGFAISAFGLRGFSARLGLRLPLRALWIATLTTVGVNVALVLAASATQVYVVYGVQIMCLTLAGMLYVTALQGLAPTPLRARVVALQTIINSAAGALAVPLVGLLSDQLKHLPNGLMVAATTLATPALLAAAWLLWRGERPYVDTAQANAAIDAAA
jgi:MFS family permease